jgi:hypothetical protein
VLLTAALTGCTGKSIEQDPIDDDEDNDHVELSFTLNVGGSRSSDGSGYGIDEVNSDGVTSDGTADENYIDPNKVRVFFSTGNSSFGGAPIELDLRSITRIDDNTYRLRAETKSLPSSTDCRIFVTANWQYDPGTSTTRKNNIGYWCVTQGAEYQYHYGTQSKCLTISGTANAGTLTEGSVDYRDADGNPTYYTPSEETPMPMFGIKTIYGLSSYTGKTHIDIGSIYMIRSMAKIIVRSDPNKSNCHDIESVTLRYSYDVGMCAPASIYVNSETENIDPTEKNALNVPRVFSPSTYNDGYQQTNPLRRIENLPFKKLEGNKFLIYIPSYNNLPLDNISDTKVNFMTLKMKGLETVDTLEFKDDSGKRFNLCRNYMYIYDVHTYKMPEYVVTAINSYSAADINFN